MVEGALRAHREGIVTACSVVASGPALEHAAAVLRDVPSIDVGVHLTLVGERPVLPAREVPSLVTRDGSFHSSYRTFVPLYLVGRVDLSEVERELGAQIERLLAVGLRPVHANGHQHVHVLPAIIRVVATLCERYGIRYVRVPDEPLGPASVRSAALAGLFALSSRARAVLRERGVAASDRTIGVTRAGRIDAEWLADRIGTTRSGLAEVVAHVGIGTAAIEDARRWGYTWDRETDALCDPQVRGALSRSGSRLTRIADLAA